MREKLDPESLKNGSIIAKLKDGEEQEFEMKHATPQPMTVNQMYGWYSDRAHRYLRRDRGTFVFPHENDPLFQQVLMNKKNI